MQCEEKLTVQKQDTANDTASKRFFIGNFFFISNASLKLANLSSVNEKFSNTEAELKKIFAYVKKCVF